MISKFLSTIFKRKIIPKGEDVEKHPAGSWDIWFKLKMAEDIIPAPNPVHLKILLEGVEKWNLWRKENEDVKPDLKGANLSGLDLRNANFVAADLYKSRLFKTKLDNADCYGANFKEALLPEASFVNADIRGANFEGTDLMWANLEKATAIGTNFQKAFMRQTNLKSANIGSANFNKANVVRIEYDRKTRFFGIRVHGSYGNPRFKRYAEDQDFIEEFKSCSKWRALYWPWLIFMDCGRSFGLWATWSMFFAIFFGFVYSNWNFLAEISWLPSWIKEIMIFLSPEIENIHRTAFTGYYFSFVTFTTLGFGDVTPLNWTGELWVTIEVVMGYLMLGGLISILANKIGRRS